VGVVVADAIDVVILHEEYHRDSHVGKDLPVRVKKRTVHIPRNANFAMQLRIPRYVRDGFAIRAAATACPTAARRLAIPLIRLGIPHHVEGKMIAVDEGVAIWYSGCERKGERAPSFTERRRFERKRAEITLQAAC
jgi:hypothetical protein